MALGRSRKKIGPQLNLTSQHLYADIQLRESFLWKDIARSGCSGLPMTSRKPSGHVPVLSHVGASLRKWLDKAEYEARQVDHHTSHLSEAFVIARLPVT
jgi:hypothetical protein